MSNGDNGDKSSLKNNALNRRNILLGGTTLAAASAIVANNPVQVAQAQTQPGGAGGQAEHPRHLGRRHRRCQHQRLLERRDGL
jgi:hypothetical protein